MRCRRSCCVSAIVLLLLSLVVVSQVSAATVLTNVAAGKPTTGTQLSASYAPQYAVDEYVWHQAGTCFVAPATVNSWWQVDLEQTRDVESITIYSQLPVLHDRVNGAWLRAYDADLIQIGAETVLSGFSDETRAVTFDNGGLGWDGARYLKVGGEDGKGVVYLAMAQFEARAQVQAYPNFITGITATSTNLYADGGDVRMQNEYVVNNMGMDDQSGPLVGNPDALHRMSNSALWCTGALEPEETPSISFDLGGTYDLARMLIWNSNQNAVDQNRGLKDVLIEASVDGENWTSLEDQNGEEPGNYTIGISPATVAGEWIPYTGDVDLNGITASHVRITALSSHGAAGTWGLSEVRLYAVPEPSMLALLALGLAALLTRRVSGNR